MQEPMSQGLKLYHWVIFFMVSAVILIQIGIHEGRKLEREDIIKGYDLEALQALTDHQAKIAKQNAKDMLEANRKGAGQ